MLFATIEPPEISSLRNTIPTPQALLTETKKLRDAREQLKSSARQYQRDIRTGGTALALPQSGQLGQTYLSQYRDLINDILKIDVDKLDVAGYNPTIGARVVKISLTDKK